MTLKGFNVLRRAASRSMLAVVTVLSAIVGSVGPQLTSPATARAQAGGVTVEADIVYGERNGEPLTLDAYLPPDAGSVRPAVVFVHGGGWSSGDKSSFEAGGLRVARLGWVGFSISYTLKPPRWPAEVEDVQSAVAWIRSNAGRFGVDPDAIGLVGASAGGNLAMLAAIRGLDQGSASDVAAVVTWSGPMDLASLARAMSEPTAACGGDTCPQQDQVIRTVEEYLGCPLERCPGRYRDASPASWIDPSDPPALLVNSDEEFIPLSQAESMAESLKEAGVTTELLVLPGRRHALGYANDAWPATQAFLERWLVRDEARDEDTEGRLGRPVLLPLGVGVLILVAVVVAVLVARRRSRQGAG